MNTDFCLLDASAFSLGFAASHKNTLILEKTENVLSDFINSIRPSVLTKPKTVEGRAFAEYLKNTGCVSDDGILDSPSLAPAAAGYAVNEKFNILLGIKIISCEKNLVRLYTNSGIQNIVCGKIIRIPEAKTDRKILRCIVSGTDYKTLSAFEKFGGRSDKSFEKDEFILSLPFSADCRFNDARIEFVNKIKDCFGTLLKIDAFATDFDCGNGFGGIIEEFEAGVNYDLL